VPLLPDKATFLISWLLAIAAALGAVEASGWLRHHADQLWPACVVLVFIVAFALGQAVPGNIAFVKEQRAEKYPHELLAGYRRVVGDHREVLLTEVVPLDLYLPNVFLFNAWNANYANPVGGFTDRAALIQRLGEEHDPRVFALVLRENQFDRISQLVFYRGSRTYRYTDDDFPNGTRSRVVNFQPAALVGFTQMRTNELEIFVPPRARLGDTPCDVLRSAEKRYHPFLDAAVRAEYAQRCAR
jgi:Arabinofuranosyltransferase A C terminal